MLQRVLVIDSDPRSLRSTADLLEGRGVEVVGASSLEEVQQALSGGSPRVVLIEPDLDGIDGFELCRTILDSHEDESPVVLIASHRLQGKEQHYRAQEVGAQLFLERPAKDPLLAEAVVRVMESSPESAVASPSSSEAQEPEEHLAEEWIDEALAKIDAEIGPSPPGGGGTDRPPSPESGSEPTPAAAADPEPSPPTPAAIEAASAAPSPEATTVDQPSSPAKKRRQPRLPGPPVPRPGQRLLALAVVGIAGAVVVGLFVFGVGFLQDRPRTPEAEVARPETLAGVGGRVLPPPADTPEPTSPADVVIDEPAEVALETREPVSPVPRRSDPPPASAPRPATGARTAEKPRVRKVEPGVATEISAWPASGREAVPVEAEPLPQEIATADEPTSLAPAPEKAPVPEPAAEPARDPVAPGDGAAVDRPVTGQPAASTPTRATPAPEAAIEATPAPVATPVREDPPTVVPDSRVAPRYPLAARRARVGGTVVMQVTVRRDGTVDRVEVVEDPAPGLGLGQAAAAAVRRWRFEPGRRNGRTVDSTTVVRVNFESD